MKKILLFSALFLIPSLLISTNAQYKKNEIELGVGIFNFNEIINITSDVIISSVPTGTTMENSSSYGSVHAAYKYRIRERIGVGGLFAFDYSTAEAMRYDIKIGDFKKRHYTLAAEADFIYLNFDRFKMYALAGVGATLYGLTYTSAINGEKDNNTTPYFTFQVTPIGIRYGERFGGFLEVGFGYRGILNAGIFVRL
ncbi:hypothetical protein D0T49_09980 [Paludibacter sp. 221]|uniref:hypothetical protein n=1 Tax=Paludibacter sp. 221 TaxID=2302939 RepID=UPI0013D26488|nr:hypothetical protein [Paludibacter sp. 221]NDV47373.1 hypothetical protein [Paludibacter sp. 221]